jgi:hypothetical protein
MNGFYSRINGYDNEENNDFIYRNTYNLKNEYFCDDDGKLIYLMIGWEDCSYLGYNFQTGKYADLDETAHDEYMIFHSFSDLFIHHLEINSYEDELKEFFQEYIEQTREEDIKYQEEHLALGNAYYKGEGVEQDYTKAFYHYREAAERDHPESPSAAEADVILSHEKLEEIIQEPGAAEKHGFTSDMGRMKGIIPQGRALHPPETCFASFWLSAAELRGMYLRQPSSTRSCANYVCPRHSAPRLINEKMKKRDKELQEFKEELERKRAAWKKKKNIFGGKENDKGTILCLCGKMLSGDYEQTSTTA